MIGDLDNAKEKVEKASGFFDTLNGFIKKHPIWAALIAITALSEFGYLGWITTHPDEEPIEEQYYGEDIIHESDSTYYDEQLYDSEITQ